jgi:hypothetical protein
MRDKPVEIGQRFLKADGTGLIFEVVDLIMSQNLPHARIIQVDNPTERRVIALCALQDRQHYMPAQDGMLPLARRPAPLAFATASGD